MGGATASGVQAAHPQTVYPRVGGATTTGVAAALPNTGLPPRGRGNLRLGRTGPTVHRSTPAWAGQPSPASQPRNSKPVYPRVGGATAEVKPNVMALTGLPPRGRGNRQLSPRQWG